MRLYHDPANASNLQVSWCESSMMRRQKQAALRVGARMRHVPHLTLSFPWARSLWFVAYLLGANQNYLSKGPGFLDPRWSGARCAA